jgi:putrescine aminotransferase
MTHFWHPVSDMSRVLAGGELVIERGEGVYLWDTSGRKYIDAAAGGLWYCMVGYGRTEIAEAADRQLRTMPAYSCYADTANPPVLELADRIASIAPMDDPLVFFATGGGEAIDTAAKLARRHWSLQGRDQRTIIISREMGYHGLNAFGTTLAGHDSFQAGVGPLVGDTMRVPWNSAEALAQAIESVGAERVAAFFCEPVVGAGGVLFPPAGYLEDVRRICRETGVLFLADEVICGYGRCGDWFASKRFGLDPDLITFAKGVTSGYLPLSGVIVARRVAEPFLQPDAGVWRHGYTYSGHATSCAAALANLDIIENEGLLGRALELETEIEEAFRPLADHPLVSEIRTDFGVLAAVVLADPSVQEQVIKAAREEGLLIRMLMGAALQVCPALVITRTELDELVGKLGAALDRVREPVAA